MLIHEGTRSFTKIILVTVVDPRRDANDFVRVVLACGPAHAVRCYSLAPRNELRCYSLALPLGRAMNCAATASPRCVGLTLMLILL